MRAALFLDRDGTIIHDENYLADPSRVRALAGAADALAAFRAEGKLVVVVSNQSGIARGLIRPDQHDAVHARVMAVFAEAGAPIDAAYYCTHGSDDGCACRKPLAGMLLQAAREHEIDLPASIMIGDKPSDVEAGRAAGCGRSLLFRGDWTSMLAEIRSSRAC